MRVVQLVTRGDVIGGAQIHVLRLASQLKMDGHEVIVFTGSAGQLTRQLDDAGVPWTLLVNLNRQLRPLRDVLALWELRTALAKVRPDIVACHSSKAGMVGRIAARSLSLPNVFTAHGWAFTEGVRQPMKFAYKTLEKWLAKLTDAAICVSDYDRKLGIETGISAEKLFTIHNGVPDHESVQLKRHPQEPLRVVMIGRFDAQKDQATLLRAASLVPGVELHFVGEGPTLESSQRLARDLGLEHRCRFYGYQRDVTSILCKGHVFSLISNYEGFPISTVEAMRAALPVIVSDVGGAAEAVEEMVSGYTVSRGDAVGIAHRLSLLCNDEDLRLEMGAAARQRFLRLFTFETMYVKTMDVYAHLAPYTDGHGSRLPMMAPSKNQLTN